MSMFSLHLRGRPTTYWRPAAGKTAALRAGPDTAAPDGNPNPGTTMTEGSSSLAALRQQIDGIDDAVHDLLMRRAAIAGEIRSSKGGGPVWRPAREAQVLRRLMERHAGRFPRATVVQIWREIMSAMVRLQGEFAVAVYATETYRTCRDLARDHFGAETPIALYSSMRAVLTAVQDGSAAVGVLPLPEDSEDAPWWPILAGMSGERPTVAARLPFAPSSPGSGDSALCVARIQPEQSGSDRSLYAIRTSPVVSRARLNDAIAAAGIRPRQLIGRGPSIADTAVFLAELEGYAGPDDSRLKRLADPDKGLAEATVFLGVYATPFEPSALADRGDV